MDVAIHYVLEKNHTSLVKTTISGFASSSPAMQTEAELVGAAQSVTGSLQRSRQIMLEQIDNTQSILASMDASHEQLSKVTKEYQGQSDVFGNSKRLLRTLRRHSTWDKLVLYGGATMFLLVCLYVIQKRSLYFVPTFVKTGLGRLVPTWSRSSASNIDHLTRPMKGEPKMAMHSSAPIQNHNNTACCHICAP